MQKTKATHILTEEEAQEAVYCPFCNFRCTGKYGARGLHGLKVCEHFQYFAEGADNPTATFKKP